MNHYLRKYLNKIWCVLFYRRHHTFDVKTCFQQNRYVFDVIGTSWALFVFCISWNFARGISTFSKKLSTSVVVYQTVNHANNNLCTWQNGYTDSDCPSGIFKFFLRICWIVPTKYLLLLDQTILLHFKSSIDRWQTIFIILFSSFWSRKQKYSRQAAYSESMGFAINISHAQ
jgi:hypothetical protein